MERGIEFALTECVGTGGSRSCFWTCNAKPLDGRPYCDFNVWLHQRDGPRRSSGLLRNGEGRPFFAGIGSLNSSAVPRNALLLQCFWASLLTLSGTYGDLLDYVIFAVLIFYVLTTIGLFVLRRTQPQAERPYKAWGYPVIPAIYIVAASFIAVDLLVSPKTRANTWPGLLIVLAGVPAYAIWRRAGAAARGAGARQPSLRIPP
ncbi:MAG: amino acid permease [Verrucomicrobiota bacterium]